MQENWPFVRNDLLPSWWANAVQKFLSGLSGNVVATKINDTTVEVWAGADEDAAVLTVDGRWRWRETPVQRAHPGGAAGVYVLWATAADNSVNSTPLPGTDHTVYAFDLAITSGAAPGGVALARKIANVIWDGVKITGVNMLLGPGAAGAAVRRARVDRVAAQAGIGGAATALIFDTETFDTDGMADLATTPTQLTCQTAGVYAITGRAIWTPIGGAPGGDGGRTLRLQRPSVGILDEDAVIGDVARPVAQQVSAVLALAAGDVFELVVVNTAGTVRTVMSAWLSAVRLGPV